MYRYFAATVLAIAGLLWAGRDALAEDAAQPIYVVTYMEIAPGLVSEARPLITAYSADARKASGAVEVDALERIGYPNHFALIEQWQSPGAKQAFASTEAATKFRAALGRRASVEYRTAWTEIAAIMASRLAVRLQAPGMPV